MVILNKLYLSYIFRSCQKNEQMSGRSSYQNGSGTESAPETDSTPETNTLCMNGCIDQGSEPKNGTECASETDSAPETDCTRETNRLRTNGCIDQGSEPKNEGMLEEFLKKSKRGVLCSNTPTHKV